MAGITMSLTSTQKFASFSNARQTRSSPAGARARTLCVRVESQPSKGLAARAREAGNALAGVVAASLVLAGSPAVAGERFPAFNQPSDAKGDPTAANTPDRLGRFGPSDPIKQRNLLNEYERAPPGASGSQNTEEPTKDNPNDDNTPGARLKAMQPFVPSTVAEARENALKESRSGAPSGS